MFHAPVPGANMVTGRIEYVEVRDIVIKSQCLPEVIHTTNVY